MLGLVAIAEVAISSLGATGGTTYNESATFNASATVAIEGAATYNSDFADWLAILGYTASPISIYQNAIAFDASLLLNNQASTVFTGQIGFIFEETLDAASQGVFGANVSFTGRLTLHTSSYDQFIPYIDGQREFTADFDTGLQTPSNVVIPVGLSTTIRPDALTFDLRTAFTLGPEFEGVPGGDILDRPWYVRVDGLNVYTSRANDANTAWSAENLLFSFSGVAITAFDCAFEQNARFVIAAERPTGVAGAPEIWIYWYNPGVASYVFQNFGPGRNPQVVLDDPYDTTTSDVLVGYIKDGTGYVVRVQRELYATEHTTPWIDTTEWYLEELARLRGYRLGAFFTYHDVFLGRYIQGRLESALYPVYSRGDGFGMGASMLPGTLLTAAIALDQFVEDALGFTPAFFAGSSLVDIVIDYTDFVEDAFELTTGLAAGSALDTIVIVQDQFIEDAFESTIAFAAGSALVNVVIVQNQPVDDAFAMSADIQGGSLAIP